MKTNRKTRPQPSLAPLSAEEYHQLADMVRTRTYDDILQQIVKPRAEGGFDLDISIKPLQVLHRRVTELDRVNKLIADGQKLTLTAYDELQAGQTPPTEQIHNAILNATWLQIQHSENTPHQLLALQRLADFPARAEYREQTAAIRAERLEISRSKENRAQEMHTHKIALDLRKQDHKEKSDAFAQQLALSRFNLNRNLFSSTPENEDQAIASAAADDDDFDYENMPSISPNPLPPEVIAHNIAFSKKLRAGKIIIDHSGPYVRAVELPDPTSTPPEVGLGGPSSEPRDASTPTTAASLNTDPLIIDHTSPSASSAQSAVEPIPSTSVPPAPLSFADLAAAVNRYTLRRAEEYVAHERNITPWLHRTPPPKFITQHRHCPCGNACPCPHHETPEKGGPFPEEFWSHSPFGFAYSNQLFARELPYRPPSEYLA